MGASERDKNRAQALFGAEKKVDEFQEAREKERQEDAAKTARLRQLRLAKEEADRKAAAARRKPPR